MRTMPNASTAECNFCHLGCGAQDNSIEHYSLCNVYWQFVRLARPQGLGIEELPRIRATLFLVQHGMDDADR